MFRFSIADLDSFKMLVTLLCRISEAVGLEVSEKGINFLAMDRGMTTFLEVWMKRSLFGTWELSEPSKYYFDSVTMLKVVRSLDGNVVASINGPLEFVVSSKTTEKKFSLNQISKTDREPMDLSNLSKEFRLSVGISMGVIAEVMKNIADLGGDEVFFRWNAQGNTQGVNGEILRTPAGILRMDSKREVIASYSVKLNDIKVKRMEGQGQVGFKLALLEHIVQARLGDVDLDVIASDSPMFITSDSTNYYLRVVVAPFVPEREDESPSGDYGGKES
jgi:hypothetical protein